jgi:predicted nucleic-acid-binding protein
MKCDSIDQKVNQNIEKFSSARLTYVQYRILVTTVLLLVKVDTFEGFRDTFHIICSRRVFSESKAQIVSLTQVDRSFDFCQLEVKYPHLGLN